MLKPLISITYDEFCKEYAEAMKEFIKGFPPGMMVKNELALVGSIMASELFVLDEMINQEAINITHESFCETYALAMKIAYMKNNNLIIVEDILTTLGAILATNLFKDDDRKGVKVYEFRKRND